MTPWIITLLSLIVLTTLSLRNLRYGILWVIALLPLYELGRVHIGPIPTTVVELNILLLFGWWTTSQVTKTKKRSFKEKVTSYKLQVTELLGSWSLLILGWLAVASFSTLISPSLREAAGMWKAFFVEPILFLVVFINLIKKEHVAHVFNTLIASGTFVAIVGVVQKFTGWWIENSFWAAESTRRVTSVFPFPNAVGLYLAPIAIIALVMAVSKLPKITTISKEQKTILLFTVYCLLFTVMLLAIIFARSRGALLGISIGIILLGCTHIGKRIWYWLGIGIAIVVLMLSGTALELKQYIANQPTSFSGGNSNAIRVELWKESFSFLKDHPALGSRMAGFPHAVAPYHKNPAIEIYKYPHNVFLNFWTELGLAGFILFCLIIIKLYSRTVLHLKKLPIADHQLRITILASTTTLLVHGLVDVPYFKNDLSVLFWILIGVSIIITSKDRTLQIQ